MPFNTNMQTPQRIASHALRCPHSIRCALYEAFSLPLLVALRKEWWRGRRRRLWFVSFAMRPHHPFIGGRVHSIRSPCTYKVVATLQLTSSLYSNSASQPTAQYRTFAGARASTPWNSFSRYQGLAVVFVFLASANSQVAEARLVFGGICARPS